MTTIDKRAEQLFTDYCLYWRSTSNIQKLSSQRPISSPKYNAQRKELFEATVQWCMDRKIDPRMWMYFLFRRRRWTFAPKLLKGHLMTPNPKMESGYRRMVQKEHLDGYRAYLYQPRPEDAVDPNRDLVPKAEAMKSRYLNYNQLDLCLLNMPDETFGFHPKSHICQACPRAIECAHKLQNMVSFDILALRKGEITVEEARAQSGC